MRKPTLIGVLVLGLGAALWFGRAQVFGKERRAPSGEIVTATPRDLETFVKATGIVKPRIGAEVRVGTPLTGVVRKIYVRTGDRVKAGQALLELDRRALGAKQDQAAAALASAEATLAYAEADRLRQKELATSGAIAAAALESAERTYAVSRAKVDSARAELAYARTQWADARILAPISAVVAAMSIQQGETIASGPSQPATITLIDLERLEIWAYVDETDIGRIAPQQPVKFSVDTYPNHEFEGRVTTIYPKPEIRDNVVNFVVCVEFTPSPEHVLRPEMTTNVQILTAKRGEVLTVARRAVRRERGQPYVMLASGGTATRRAIAVGIHDDNYVEITRGLDAGAEVLIAPAATDANTKEPPR